MRYYAIVLAVLSINVAARERVVGLPCEGCEAVFDGMPITLQSRANIAPTGEAGVRMLVQGRALSKQGTAKAGVVVYAYQTNVKGLYPSTDASGKTATNRHGALRAWAETDINGHYAFETIRPAGYPNSDLPEHIHMHVIERDCATYYIDDIVFTDDPRLTPQKLKTQSNGRAGSGVSTPTKRDGKWFVTRDIQLGKDIPGYPDCK
jgi:protocatechuate 3,4-dioxygenase beta subunit